MITKANTPRSNTRSATCANLPLMEPRSERLFYERQSFKQRRIRVLVAIPPLILTLLAIWQVGLGHPFGKQPMSNARIVGWTIFLWLVYLRLLTVRLVTEVRAGELLVSMRGLWRSRKIRSADIKSVEVVTVDAARDYGGYGIRSTRQGTAYLAGGNQGVRVELKRGLPVIVGSERAPELADAVNRVIHE
jgi:hypothetical protein